MLNLIQMLIQKLILKRLGNAFMPKHNLGDSYKLISSLFSIQVICNVYKRMVSLCVCVCVCVCVSVCVFACVHLKVNKDTSFVQ